jgi:hypothetical protein
MLDSGFGGCGWVSGEVASLSRFDFLSAKSCSKISIKDKYFVHESS